MKEDLQEAIVRAIIKDPIISDKALAAIVGISCRKKDLALLRELGMVDAAGRGRGARYWLKKHE